MTNLESIGSRTYFRYFVPNNFPFFRGTVSMQYSEASHLDEKDTVGTFTGDSLVA